MPLSLCCVPRVLVSLPCSMEGGGVGTLDASEPRGRPVVTAQVTAKPVQLFPPRNPSLVQVLTWRPPRQQWTLVT